ncbi:protoporphyrinogen oxidase [Paenibacillus turpanensis]|uniref:protoporphyrinogen oxidase n=1 Tax=Paenibacillus turpanensis TaxID=2689078 RepID=UPI00140DEC22|nr:protoporphyrinogen oxidase [Paenibacillus turpanensis]
MEAKTLVIVGGGITGLSAAFYAKQAAARSGAKIRIVLIEKAPRLGGKIHTLRRDGFVIEKGPDSFLSRKLPILELTRDLNFDSELVPLDPNNKKTYILHHGKLHRIPPGTMMGIPTEVGPFVLTGLLSLAGKLRAGLDLVLPRRNEDSDESLGHFLERRLGREVLQHVAEPLLGGIYAGDVYKLSLRATFPQFQQLEKKYRSLILGMKAGKTTSNEGTKLPELARQSAFLSYGRGLESLSDRLIEELQGIELWTGTQVMRIDTDPSGGKKLEYKRGEERGELLADGVIVTLPAYAVPELFPSVPAVAELEQIPYVSVANVAIAFDRSQLKHPLDASGFVIPRTEGTFMTACTWTSSKWSHVAPKDKALIRCYVGRTGEEEWQQMDDQAIVQRVRGELKHLMGIDAEPLFYEVTRLMNSMPQYPVGHLDRLRKIRAALNPDGVQIWLAGGAYEGVGLPDCIRQGRDAARDAVSRIAGE